MCISSLRVSTVKWASSFCKAGIVVLLMQATSAAAYDFNLSGASDSADYASQIYASADYYQSHDISPNQYTSDLLSALGSINTDNATVDLGFGNATAEALERGNYRAFNYACVGASAFNPTPDGGEGPEGQLYCDEGVGQVCLAATNGVNTTAAIIAALDAGHAIDNKFGTDVADTYPRALEF